MAEDRFEELLGSYLLGELTLEEARELESHLEECSECRRELDRARQAHAHLLYLAAHEPPADMKERVLAQARGEVPARPRGWRPWVTAAAAALLLVAVLSVGLLRTITDNSSTGVPLTATDLAPQAGGQVHVDEVGENLQVELEVWGMPKLGANEYYEMWYYAEDGGRISCGTFRVGPGGRTSADLTAPASVKDYPEIEITREPDDGDPKASGEGVLEGRFQST